MICIVKCHVCWKHKNIGRGTSYPWRGGVMALGLTKKASVLSAMFHFSKGKHLKTKMARLEFMWNQVLDRQVLVILLYILTIIFSRDGGILYLETFTNLQSWNKCDLPDPWNNRAPPDPRGPHVGCLFCTAFSPWLPSKDAATQISMPPEECDFIGN